jgi:hypothetical protein
VLQIGTTGASRLVRAGLVPRALVLELMLGPPQPPPQPADLHARPSARQARSVPPAAHEAARLVGRAAGTAARALEPLFRRLELARQRADQLVALVQLGTVEPCCALQRIDLRAPAPGVFGTRRVEHKKANSMRGKGLGAAGREMAERPSDLICELVTLYH